MSEGPFRQLVPAIVAASSFACANVLSKVVFTDGGDVLTLLSIRSVAGLAFIAAWLWTRERPPPFSPRERWIALGLGLLFAVTVFGVLKAIDLMDVPTASLAYFVYPLITGLVAALFGLERLGWRGATAAVVAFVGLALTIRARPGDLALAGVLLALVAAVTRAAMLLITRALLTKSDPRLSTWYSLLSSTGVFVAISLATWDWTPPHTAVGWASLVGISAAMPVAILSIFISTGRIGPFRTALIMNLEPLLGTIGGVILLGNVLAPIQALGAAIMLAALVAFQMRR